MFYFLLGSYVLLLTCQSIGAEFMNVEDFVKIRCSLDGEDVFFIWEGKIFSYVPQEEPQHLFNFIGYNIGRCEKIDDTWWLITRELSYYLDPKTHQKMQSWENPFTGESVTVVHVANDPVNNKMYPAPYSMTSSKEAVINSDFPLFYPNPLATNETFYEYGGDKKFYEAGEFFKFYFNVEDLKEEKNKIDDVPISWSRVGQWLPWMHMGSKEGGVLYSVSGGRAKDLSGAPLWLQRDVNSRLPLYLTAPSTYDPEIPNETSNSYFMDNFEEYLAGETFPLPEPREK